ncbi:hypothetical protein V5799_005565 [Amblyomma americanum]|uniref:Uncharacterized protein n=1 Tax=Amblyomma americanum TaxID=6943 RepID=A0AAQ4DYW6_AMBAM
MPAKIITAVYAGVHRVIWTLPFWWLHYACITGRGARYVKRRIYLFYSQTLDFIGISVLSMTLALLLNVTCETPIEQLDRLVFRSVDKRIMNDLNSIDAKKQPLPVVIENNHEKSRL